MLSDAGSTPAISTTKNVEISTFFFAQATALRYVCVSRKEKEIISGNS